MDAADPLEIVSCHYKEELRWLEDSPYPVNVVGKEGGDTTLLETSKFKSVNVIPNFGLEASSYLWFIIKRYDSLPERVAFIHGHENSPHQRIPIFQSIQEYGFISHFVDLNRFMNEYMILVPKSPFHAIWNSLMSPYFGDMPKVINFRGMAQFAIHRDAILFRPKWLYEWFHEASSGISKNPNLKNWLGYFFECFWHIIFGSNSPLEDKPRINLIQSGNFNILDTGRIIPDCSKDFTEDYIDVFIDSNLKVYQGPWEFMQSIASLD